MTGLLEFREKLKLLYSKGEVFIVPIVKFLLAFVVLNTINGSLGYMTQLDNVAIVLIAALACSFLPLGGIVFFAVAFSLAHMYALSLEVAIVGVGVYLLLFLLFFRFGHTEAIVVVLTPLLCMWKIPYVMPVAMGLLGSPASAVSVGCGVVVYYLITTVAGSANAIGTMGAEEAAAKLRLIIDGLLKNKGMLVMVAAFAITVIVVYLIRRMSVDYSWTIASVAGAMTNLVILLVGDLIYDTNLSMLNLFFGAIIAILAAKVIEFLRFCVDYSRTEKVQFEDDEYYYYVKAVPKMTVAAQTKTVKKINTQRRSGSSAGRNVTTESFPEENAFRYGEGRGKSAYGQRNSRVNSARSVTINTTAEGEEEFSDGYEELF